MGAIAFTISKDYLAFIYLLVLARIGYSLCNVFYDSMLTDVTTNDRMDHVSGSGYAFGYVFSTIPFIAAIGMIIALLMTQFVAFPFAIMSGRLAKKFGQINLLRIYILIYIVIAVIGFFMSQTWHFWLLAFLVGLAQGGIQSISRSYFGQLVPKNESNEYFGFFDIFGKFADFLGPLFMVFSANIFGTSRYGILALVLLFIIGIILLGKTKAEEEKAAIKKA